MANTGTVQTSNPLNAQKSNFDMSLVGATDRGTKIVKGGANLDKNAFLKILSAELANQDPTNAKDSTAYISQLAQFSSLEQMTNLNSTMSFNSASNLVGKNVVLKIVGSDGQLVQGYVKNVGKNGDTVKLNVITPYGEVTANFNDVIGVNEQSKMDMASAASLMGKSVKILAPDSSGNTYEGIITAVNKYADGITVKLKVNQVSVNKYMAVSEGKTDAEPPVLEGVYTGTSDNVMQVRYNKDGDCYEYRYKSVNGNEAGSTDWKKLEKDETVVDGIKIKLPKEKQDSTTIFEASLPAQKEQTIELPVDNIMEVKEAQA